MNDEIIEMSEALERLKAHYIYHHLTDENNYHFKQLCKMEFKNCMVKKNHEEGQMPVNVPGNGPIKY